MCGPGAMAAAMITESAFLERAKDYIQPSDPVAVAGFQAPRLQNDATEAEKAEFTEKFAAYRRFVFKEFTKIADGDKTALVYLALQPIWRAAPEGCPYTLAGAEVLIRAKNGRDEAPMPGLALFQTAEREAAARFLAAQIRWAADRARDLPAVWISVNVRPDELAAVKDVIIETRDVRNLVFEITEYAPIDETVLGLIAELQSAFGTQFAMDDVNSVQEGAGFGMPGKHSTTFELAKREAHLFAVQKLALPLAVQAWDVSVFPTPQYAGGKPLPYFESQKLPYDTPEGREQIKKRKELIEDWVASVLKARPTAKFVIEASVYPSDLDERMKDRYPDIDLFNGKCLIQGGKSGGRAFPPECFDIDTKGTTEKICRVLCDMYHVLQRVFLGSLMPEMLPLRCKTL